MSTEEKPGETTEVGAASQAALKKFRDGAQSLIIIGGAAICFGCLGPVYLWMQQGHPDSEMMHTFFGVAIAGIVPIVAGAGLLRKKEWGRRIALIICWACIVLIIGFVVLAVLGLSRTLWGIHSTNVAVHNVAITRGKQGEAWVSEIDKGWSQICWLFGFLMAVTVICAALFVCKLRQPISYFRSEEVRRICGGSEEPVRG